MYYLECNNLLSLWVIKIWNNETVLCKLMPDGANTTSSIIKLAILRFLV